MVASHNASELSAKFSTRGAIALDPRNFTSVLRTPWAGTALAASIKSDFADSSTQKIGESWEISCDPDAPSRIAADSRLTLSELINAAPESCLSSGLVDAGRNSCDILVKLLNADSPLSLQIHPSDDNPALKPSECGKPESWLVLNAAPGSGLYLGFNQALTVEDIKARLESGTFSSDLLQFVPVAPGDFFEIDPHVPHAIGPGVILLEPQRILSGKSGKTWRLWDWNRRYNDSGALDPKNGSPRELHISQSMPLLDPESQNGQSFVNTLRRYATTISPLPGVTAQIFPENRWYQVVTLSLKPWSKVRIKSVAAYACATVLDGIGDARSANEGVVPMLRGQSYFLPAASLPMELSSRSESLFLSLVIPAGKGVVNHGGQIFE